MTRWSKYSEKLVWLLIILGAVGQKGMIAQNFHAWFNTAPSIATAGLWAKSDERQESNASRRLRQGQLVGGARLRRLRPVVFFRDGSAGNVHIGAW